MIASRVRAALLLLVSVSFAGLAHSQPPLPPLPPPDDKPTKIEPPTAGPIVPQEGVRVAQKGPIHEAFAQPGADTRGKSMTAPKAPPAPINEVPPDAKPDGDNVKWIPGYWQWDADKNDFIWVTGFYRNVPPNRDWEPGKWIVKDDQNVYVPGYWKPVAGGALSTVPEPPKSVESGPSIPNSNPDAMWVPGGWEYRGDQFAWRAGYWAAPYRDLMWQPSQYVFNGDNYTYVPGYWDYPLESRGLLYAPVYINPQVIQSPGFSYTPQYGIGMGNGNGWGSNGLFDSLYMGPNYNNYYYGDYGNPYGLGGLGFGLGDGALMGYGGFYPWWSGGLGFYNPLWNLYDRLNRGNPGWGGRNGGRGGREGREGREGVGARGGRTELGSGPHVRAGAAGTRAAGPAVAGAAGLATQSAARAAAAAQSGPLIRPANQVLASQAARTGVTANGASGTRSFSGAGAQAGGVNIRPGVGGVVAGSGGYGVGGYGLGGYGLGGYGLGGYGLRGVGSEPILRGGSEFGGVRVSGGSGYRGAAYGGARAGGGGARGGGGHR